MKLLALLLPGVLGAASLVSTYSANTWVQITPSGVTASVTGYDKLVYIPAIQRSCILGQYHTQGTEQNRAMLCYSMRENRWDVLSLTPSWHNGEGCNGHPVGAWEADPSTSRIYGTGCYSGSNVPDNTKIGPFVFDPIARVGRLVQTATTLDYNTQQATGIFDPFNKKMVLWGDSSQQITEFDPSTNVLTPNVAGLTCVGGLCPATNGLTGAAISTSDKHLYLYQGQSVYKYNPATKLWTKLTVSGTPPSTRIAAGWAYSSADNIFLLHGGWNGASTYYTDTWAFDPVALTWTNMNPSAFPVALTTAAQVFERLAYDESQDAFLALHVNGSGGITYWVYRYRGGGIQPGSETRAYTATAGLNRSSTQWAMNGAASTDGTNTYVAWAETSTTYDTPHIAVSKIDSGGSVSTLGALNAISGAEAAYPSVAVISGDPWVCWHEGIAPSDAQCKSWNGSAWSGGSIGYRNLNGAGAPFLERGKPHIVGVGSVPYVAYIEQDRGIFFGPSYVNVMKYSSSAWSLVGSILNAESGLSRGDSVSIASDGNNPWVAWTEYVTAPAGSPPSIAQSNPKVHVKQWTGSTWTECGSNANVSGTGWAYDVAIAWMAAHPYITFSEKSSASAIPKVYVRTWSGTSCSSGSWSTVGSALNRDAVTGWAVHPSISSDGTTVHVSWQEQGNSQSSWVTSAFGSFGQLPQIYSATLSGGSWVLRGSSLNAATADGAAGEPAIAELSGGPVVAWGEIAPGNTRQIYAKKWDGVNWSQMSASVVPCAISTTSLPPATVGQFYTATVSQNGACAASSWGGWSSCQGIALNVISGVLSGMVTGVAGTCSGTFTYDTASQALSISVASSRGLFPLPFPVKQ